MKKLLFVLAFAFIGQQALSQMYVVTYTPSNTTSNNPHPSNCPDYVLTKIDPSGNVTYTCIEQKSLYTTPSTLLAINQEINIIINQGYKLVYTTVDMSQYNQIDGNSMWYFAIP